MPAQSLRPPVLLLSSLSPEQRARVSAHFELLDGQNTAQREAVLARDGARIRAVLTIGAIALHTADVARMPQLSLVCCLGAGYEGLDVADLKQRGIAVANGAGTNDRSVADHALALMLALVRQIRTMDAACRRGEWRAGMHAPAQLTGKKLGIYGLGTIGMQIAKRAAAFDMPVAYCNRRPRSDVPHTYFEQVLDLARWSDVLVVAVPGGEATRHAVNAQVLDALGPRGFLVNIGRGSVVDTDALATALQTQRIAAAGLDVYEGEPKRPEALIGLENLIITPHIAGWSPEAIEAMTERFLDNALGHFAGTGVVSPV